MRERLGESPSRPPAAAGTQRRRGSCTPPGYTCRDRLNVDTIVTRVCVQIALTEPRDAAEPFLDDVRIRRVAVDLESNLQWEQIDTEIVVLADDMPLEHRHIGLHATVILREHAPHIFGDDFVVILDQRVLIEIIILCESGIISGIFFAVVFTIPINFALFIAPGDSFSMTACSIFP